jgi:UDP-galactopyranose mutase
VFFSGPLDGWFGYREGSLGYRTLDFQIERHISDYQGNAVINYCGPEIPWTRITEHKHFTPWEAHKSTVIYKEFSRAWKVGDVEYYPVRLAQQKQLLAVYANLARLEKKVTFVGRLGTYRYLDMHVTIAEALDAVDAYVQDDRAGRAPPPFFVDPLES